MFLLRAIVEFGYVGTLSRISTYACIRIRFNTNFRLRRRPFVSKQCLWSQLFRVAFVHAKAERLVITKCLLLPRDGSILFNIDFVNFCRIALADNRLVKV